MPLSTSIMLNIIIYIALFYFFGWAIAVPLIVANHVIGAFIGLHMHRTGKRPYHYVSTLCLK